jgi:hypothetical protein
VEKLLLPPEPDDRPLEERRLERERPESSSSTPPPSLRDERLDREDRDDEDDPISRSLDRDELPRESPPPPSSDICG